MKSFVRRIRGRSRQAANAAAKRKPASHRGAVPWLVLTAVALVVLGFVYFYRSRPHSEGSRQSPLSLKVASTEAGLQVSWNGNSPEIQGATEGVITVTDSTGIRRISLNSEQIRLGYITCSPAPGDVYFRMEVPLAGRLITDSTHVVLVNRPSDAQAAALAPEKPSAFEGKEPQQKTARRADSSKPVAPRGGAEEQKVLKPFPWSPSSRAADPARELPPAPALPSSLPGGSPILPSGPELSHTATATCEPVGPSGLRRVIGRIPVFNRLTPQASGKGFHPAQPVRPITLTLPPDGSGRLAQRKTIDVRTRVDESGRVIQVEVPSEDAALINLAAYASQAWRFTPARLNGKPVASDVILHFEFNTN